MQHFEPGLGKGSIDFIWFLKVSIARRVLRSPGKPRVQGPWMNNLISLKILLGETAGSVLWRQIIVTLENQAEMAVHQPEVSVELLKTCKKITTGQKLCQNMSCLQVAPLCLVPKFSSIRPQNSILLYGFSHSSLHILLGTNPYSHFLQIKPFFSYHSQHPCLGPTHFILETAKPSSQWAPGLFIFASPEPNIPLGTWQAFNKVYSQLRVGRDSHKITPYYG